MLLTGASAGALLRRSGSAVRTASVRAGTAARRTFDNLDWDGADDDDETTSDDAGPGPEVEAADRRRRGVSRRDHDGRAERGTARC